MDFFKKIDDFVVFHPDEFFSKNEFAKVIRGWNKPVPLDEAYKYYKEAFFRAPGVAIRLPEQKINPNVFGFRTSGKNIFENKKFPPPSDITNTFPLKLNIKKFSLHKVCPKGTYLIDFMINGKMVYLVCINANTRYAMVKPTNLTDGNGMYLVANARGINPYLEALERMRREVENTNPIRHLTGDGEGAFNSRMALKYYRNHNIKFHPVPRVHIQGTNKTQPLHSSLGIIDRFIRTIRDMLFIAGYYTTPPAIDEMLRQYNNAPHATLSKYLGFPASPLMVQNDPDKEEYIAWRIQRDNLATQYKDDFDLPIGSKIKVFNEKDILGKRRRIARPGVVIGRKGVLFVIQTDLGKEIVPRSKLDYMY